MAVKIMIKRKFKERNIKEISKLIRNARMVAMEFPGYIASETMWDHDDPTRFVVASMWQTLDDWNKYKNSKKRKAAQEKFRDMLTGPVEYEHYVLGIYPHEEP